MTLEQLRLFLPNLNTEGAVMLYLSIQPGTAAQVAEFTGCASRSVFRCLEALLERGKLTKSSMMYFLALPNMALSPAYDFLQEEIVPNMAQIAEVAEEVSAKNGTFPLPKMALETAPSPEENCSSAKNGTFAPEESAKNGTGPKMAQGENIVASDENTESAKNGTEQNLPILLSTSLKEESFKEKKTKKKKGESERDSYEPRTDSRIPDWVPPELWTDFCDHRNAIKNPLTTLAVSYIVADLERWLPDFGLEPTLESLRRTIRSGKWIDIYKPKPLEKTRASTIPRPRFRMTMTEEENHD